MSDLDLVAAIRAEVRARSDARGRADGPEPHVAYLTVCPREAWAKRAQRPQHPFSDEALGTFERGHLTEALVADAVERLLVPQGWTVERNVRIALRLEGGSVAGRRLDAEERVKSGEVEGHVDIVATRGAAVVVVEAKSKEVVRRGEDPSAEWRFGVQAGAYALGLGAQRFAIIVGQDFKRWWLRWQDAEAWRADVTGLMARLLTASDPSGPMPACEPPTSWWRNYCSSAECRNGGPCAEVALSAEDFA